MKYQIMKWDCDCNPEIKQNAFGIFILHNRICQHYVPEEYKGYTIGNYKHGCAGTPLYKSWVEMRKRCSDKFQLRYATYKGVKCCELWQTFEGFKDNQPAGRQYEEGLALCRKNDKGDYSPGNTRWDTISNNSREVGYEKRHKLKDGRLATNVAVQNGITARCCKLRINRRGWTVEDACTIPMRSATHTNIKQYKLSN